MNVDPSGHFTVASLLISFLVSLAFEVIEDVIDGYDIKHDFGDYLGTGISGIFGGLEGWLCA